MNIKLDKKSAAKISCCAAVLALVASASHAGSSGQEFEEAYNTLTGWIDGFLGRALAIAFLIVGLFMGIARQNLISCGVSIAVAFGLVVTPTVLDNILTTTITPETIASEEVIGSEFQALVAPKGETP